MTIRVMDMDQDGDLDILFSDRKRKKSGIYALINPSDDQNKGIWRTILIGEKGEEVMFINVLLSKQKTWSIWSAIRMRQIHRLTFHAETLKSTQGPCLLYTSPSPRDS